MFVDAFEDEDRLVLAGKVDAKHFFAVVVAPSKTQTSDAFSFCALKTPVDFAYLAYMHLQYSDSLVLLS